MCSKKTASSLSISAMGNIPLGSVGTGGMPTAGCGEIGELVPDSGSAYLKEESGVSSTTELALRLFLLRKNLDMFIQCVGYARGTSTPAVGGSSFSLAEFVPGHAIELALLGSAKGAATRRKEV